jgi:hypothetical protein
MKSSFALAIMMTASTWVGLAEQSIQLNAEVKIVWATKSEAALLLATPDTFTKQLSPFDRAVRMKRNENHSEREFLSYVSQQALEWKQTEVDWFSEAIKRIQPKLTSLSLPLPEQILLIKTTGQDEPAPYTRQNAIILPKNVVASARKPDGLLAHELFHVLSRNAPPALRSKLYGILGFAPSGEVKLPRSLQSRRITNPDSPRYDHSIQVTHQDQEKAVIPILLSKTSDFDPSADKPFFSYLEQGLLVVKRQSEQWIPELAEGLPIVLKFDEVEGFYEQIGGKRYSVFQPEEILARHFTSLIMATEAPEDEPIVSGLKRHLR